MKNNPTRSYASYLNCIGSLAEYATQSEKQNQVLNLCRDVGVLLAVTIHKVGIYIIRRPIAIHAGQCNTCFIQTQHVGVSILSNICFQPEHES